jgi:hypothetical protein
MALLVLDHLALACGTLEQGATVLRETLGVELPASGTHPVMGTHNLLTGMGPEMYFEAIAIDPEAPPVGRPRWFNLDAFSGPPRLTNWILRTESIETALEALPPGFGTPISLERGPFKWRMAVPESGVLPWGGWAPAIIEWQGAAHPTQSLPDSGLRLASLTLHHPEAEDIAQVLGPLMAADTALFMPDDAAKLVAVFDGSDGVRRLT